MFKIKINGINIKDFLDLNNEISTEDIDGTTYHYKNGLLHREDGPAVENVNGFKAWYKNGVRYEPTNHVKKLYEAGNL